MHFLKTDMKYTEVCTSILKDKSSTILFFRKLFFRGFQKTRNTIALHSAVLWLLISIEIFQGY